MAARSEDLRFVLALIASAALAAGFAVMMRAAIDGATDLLFGDEDVVRAFRDLPAWSRLLAPAIGALLGGIIAVLARRLPQSRGVGDVMEAVVLGRGQISLRASLARALASFCAIVGGGSLGREGPLIQVGAALGGASARVLGLPPSRTRILFAAGTAGGFAAAYNTPIAATLFVLEVVTGIVALEVIVPVIVAAAIATALSRLALGEGPFYGVREFTLVTRSQLAASVVLGPLGGLAGVLFMRLLAGGEWLFTRRPLPLPLRAMVGGLLVGAIAVAVPEVAGNGAQPIRELLDGRMLGPMLIALLLAKPMATTSSVSSGSAGGVFTPSMFIGAALGALIGTAVAPPGAAAATTGAFALVGMASVVAATTHAPLTAAALAFEMTGDYAIVVPLLASTALATATARALTRESLYTAELRRKGVVWDGTLAHRLARAVRAADVLEPALVVEPSSSLSEVHRGLSERRARVAYALDGAQVVAVDMRALAALPEAQRSNPMATVAQPVETLSLADELPRLAERLWVPEWGELPVLDERGEIRGIVTRRALLGALDRELLQRDLLVTRLTWSEQEPGRLIELPRGYRLGVIEAPDGFAGSPLDPASVRGETGLLVIAVQSPGARSPWRDAFERAVVLPGERWLVVGPSERVAARPTIAPSARTG